MKTKVKAGLVGLALVAVVLGVVAALNDLYVNYASGNDTADCTFTAPCKTYERAQAVFVAGDVIHFIGTYPNKISVTKLGVNIEGGSIAASQTVNEAVLIAANSVTIRNLDVSGGWAFVVRTQVAAKVDGLILDNVTIHDGVWQNRSGAKCTGAGSWGRGLAVDGATNVTLMNMKIYNNCGEGLGILHSIGVTANGINAYDNWSRNIYIDGSQSVALKDFYTACLNPNFYRTGGGQKGVGLGLESYATQLPLKNILIAQGVVEKCQGINIYTEVNLPLVNVVIRDNQFISVAAPLVNVPGAIVSNNVSVVTPAKTNTPAPAVTATPPAQITPLPPTPSFTPALTLTSTPTLAPTLAPTLTPAPATATAQCVPALDVWVCDKKP